VIVDVDFPDHWKTRLLVDALDGDEAAPVYLLRLWAHCQVRKQWTFTSFPSAALKALCRYQGECTKLELALVTSGFILRDTNGVLTVLNWDEYNAQLIANWVNGSKGGRPRKNQTGTNPEPNGNPTVSDKEDKEDKRRLRRVRRRNIFVPPTLEKVQAYCAERRNRVDPEAFLAFYEANGWVQGKNRKPIKNWKAAVLTWERNDKLKAAGPKPIDPDAGVWNPTAGFQRF
jgi:hypothetical protein